AELILDDPGMRFTLAVPPILLEEWQRVAAGTEVLRDDSVVELPADDPVARSYASTLELLREAHATGRIEMLHVPYAAPDIGALQQEGRLLDLSDHYRRSVSGYLASLEATPVPGTAVLGDVLPHGVLGLLADRGLRFAVVAPTGAVSAEETPAAGVYRAGGMSVLVADPDVSSEIETGDIEEMLDTLFEHVLSEENTAPVALTVDLGAGRPTKINDFLDALELMGATPWIELTDAASAAEHEPAPFVTLPAEVMPMLGARAGYWDAISEARRQATALARAAGDDNSIARSTNDASLIAQSRLWAGSDGRWAAADRARAFADFATLGAASVLDTVDLSAPPDLTLSSASGTVPISIVNGSGTELELTVRTRADGMSVGWTEQVLRFRPQENPVMVPVDLQSSISGQLHVEVWAGEVMLAQRNTTVRASYLDRLAIVGGVSLVLIAILLFVRRRIRAGAGAGTITTNNGSADRR
ncbi:MAG: DUF6049 family protein, partial [Coriobacteriia bacterium]|nr:DUF6049 family protein [Coriobacteriia bacterium]